MYVKWGRENFWVYGAIDLVSGDYYAQEYPQLRAEYFQNYLDWLSIEIGDDYALLQVDRASAHMSAEICWPENIIPLVQPSHSPELNPIERFWQWLKKGLKNQCFSSLDALRKAIEMRVEELTAEQVISMASYEFIWEALFYAALH